MDEILDSLKVSYAKTLDKINFNSTISVKIDANVNIKTILNVDSYLFESKIECGSGKAVLTGKIGVKVLYIDTDNITNSLTDMQNFSETIQNSSISSNCFVNILNSNIVNQVLSTDGTLKINCNVSVTPIMYLNIAMNTQQFNIDNYITKKSELNTYSISNEINTTFDYTSIIETKDQINKILSVDSYFSCDNINCYEDYACVEGKLYTNLVYETNLNDETAIKEITDSFNVKTDVQLANLDKDCVLDFSCELDKSKSNISTEVEDENNVVTLTNSFNLCGVALKPISLEVLEDLYSVHNEVELTTSNREFVKQVKNINYTENVSGEISLTENETAIDEIISNLNMSPELTNYYIKDNKLVMEGIVSSHLMYLDENKEYKQKQIEFPMIIETNIEMNYLPTMHINLGVENCKCKAKRGTIIELEYSMKFMLCCYYLDSKEMIDSVKDGKEFNFSNYDYQIFLAKPNETIWDLSKRIKISPEELVLFNKDLPTVMEGNEKLVIKR